jgi:RNA 2',3'-cyclic 3'-phosphodiesterase
MRLFIGIELDDRVKAAAGDVAERLRQRLLRAAPDLVARWVATDNLHITIWFIGEVPDDRGAAVGDALQSPFTTPAFELVLGGCGAFPPSGPPRVFWVGVREGQASMSSLYREVGERLVPLGFVPERRAYAAHLTIARVKDAGRGTSRPVRETVAALPAECGACAVRAVTLFRSRLSPRGAVYEPLLRVPLS